MLDPATKLGTSTPKVDPSGDYAWAVFRKVDQLQPGSFATLDQKGLKLLGSPSSPASNGSNQSSLRNPSSRPQAWPGMWYLSSWRDLRRRSNASHGLLNKPEITPPSHSNHRRAGTNTPYKAWLNSVSAPQSRMCALAHPNHN